jgi:hypothetical protein
MKNSEFTITFWIKVNKNPAWNESDSEINFPPFTVKNGIQVYFSKYGPKLKAYILHPEMGYRKIIANIENYLHKDAFIALTNSDKENKLYINAKLVKTSKTGTLRRGLEIGDYVMVSIKDGDLKNTKLSGDMDLILPGKIISIEDKSKVTIFFFNINETATVSKSKLKF